MTPKFKVYGVCWTARYRPSRVLPFAPGFGEFLRASLILPLQCTLFGGRESEPVVDALDVRGALTQTHCVHPEGRFLQVILFERVYDP